LERTVDPQICPTRHFVKTVSAGIKCQHSQRLQSRRSKNDPLYLVQIPVVAAPVIEEAT
jgi:hypothetical protein